MSYGDVTTVYILSKRLENLRPLVDLGSGGIYLYYLCGENKLALISCAVTAQMIRAFVFAFYANCYFSYETSQVARDHALGCAFVRFRPRGSNFL